MIDSKEGSPVVFLSYCTEDSNWRRRMEVQLGPFAAQKDLTIWSDRAIRAGDTWHDRLVEGIAKATVGILLISAEYLASPFLIDEEIPRLLRLRESQGMKVVPVICRPCAWKKVPWLAAMQVRPHGGRPLSTRSVAQAEAVLAGVVEEVLDYIQGSHSATR